MPHVTNAAGQAILALPPRISTKAQHWRSRFHSAQVKGADWRFSRQSRSSRASSRATNKAPVTTGFMPTGDQSQPCQCSDRQYQGVGIVAARVTPDVLRLGTRSRCRCHGIHARFQDGRHCCRHCLVSRRTNSCAKAREYCRSTNARAVLDSAPEPDDAHHSKRSSLQLTWRRSAGQQASVASDSIFACGRAVPAIRFMSAGPKTLNNCPSASLRREWLSSRATEPKLLSLVRTGRQTASVFIRNVHVSRGDSVARRQLQGTAAAAALGGLAGSLQSSAIASAPSMQVVPTHKHRRIVALGLHHQLRPLTMKAAAQFTFRPAGRDKSARRRHAEALRTRAAVAGRRPRRYHDKSTRRVTDMARSTVLTAFYSPSSPAAMDGMFTPR